MTTYQYYQHLHHEKKWTIFIQTYHGECVECVTAW
jgi:hypothetical protein